MRSPAARSGNAPGPSRKKARRSTRCRRPWRRRSSPLTSRWRARKASSATPSMKVTMRRTRKSAHTSSPVSSSPTRRGKKYTTGGKRAGRTIAGGTAPRAPRGSASGGGDITNTLSRGLRNQPVLSISRWANFLLTIPLTSLILPGIERRQIKIETREGA